MRFGLALPHYDFSLPAIPKMDWHYLRDWAQKAEDLGFDSIWVSDHLFLDLSKYGGDPHQYQATECFTTLAALSQATKNVRIGSLVACNDLRHPAIVAKMATTIDALSGGRFTLVLGAGWYEPEYRAAGIVFRRPRVRVQRLAEATQIIKGMLGSDRHSFSGKHYEIDEVWSLPQPPAGIPVWIGGKHDSVVRAAGRFADGFNTAWAWSPEAYGERMKLLDEAMKEAGRDLSSVQRTVGLYALPGSDDTGVTARWERYLDATPDPISRRLELRTWAADKLAGTPRAMAATIHKFQTYGVKEVILGFGLLPFQVCDASAVEDFMTEVRPLVA